jgi:hypothetical protein
MLLEGVGDISQIDGFADRTQMTCDKATDYAESRIAMIMVRLARRGVAVTTADAEGLPSMTAASCDSSLRTQLDFSVSSAGQFMRLKFALREVRTYSIMGSNIAGIPWILRILEPVEAPFTRISQRFW